MLGTQEAIYYAVPMLCVPLFADQINNCDTLVDKKVAIKLNFRSASQQEYDSAFEEISSNQTYKLEQ